MKRPRFSGPAIWRGPAQPSQQGSRGRRDGAAVAVPVRRPLELQHASHAILRDEELAYCSQLWLRRSSQPRSNRDTNLHLGRPRRISVDLARDALCAASGAPRGPKARQVGQLPGGGGSRWAQWAQVSPRQKLAVGHGRLRRAAVARKRRLGTSFRRPAAGAAAAAAVP